MNRALLIALFALSGCQMADIPAPAPSYVAAIPSAENPRCYITKVVDGDTVKMTCGAAESSVRLLGFDTPETFRSGCGAEYALGKRATVYLAKRLRMAKTIEPTVKGRDKYDRTLVALKLDGTPLAQIMVKAGLAVYYGGEKRINWCARLGYA